jgi:hypothetical protein
MEMARRQTNVSSQQVNDNWIAALLKEIAALLKQASSNIAEPFIQDCYKLQSDANSNEETYWDSDELKKVTIIVKNNSRHCKMEVSIGIGKGNDKSFTLNLGKHRSASLSGADSLTISCWGAASDKAGHDQCSGEYKIVFQ